MVRYIGCPYWRAHEIGVDGPWPKPGRLLPISVSELGIASLRETVLVDEYWTAGRGEVFRAVAIIRCVLIGYY